MSASAPTPPQGRYGPLRPSRGRVLTRWLAIALAAIAAIAIGIVAYRNLGDAPITAQRVAFNEQPGNAMEITIDVQRDDEDRAGVCIVRVRDISGAETGRKEVLITPGNQQVRMRTVIHSGTRPVTADVVGCSYAVPDYLSRR